MGFIFVINGKHPKKSGKTIKDMKFTSVLPPCIVITLSAPQKIISNDVSVMGCVIRMNIGGWSWESIFI